MSSKYKLTMRVIGVSKAPLTILEHETYEFCFRLMKGYLEVMRETLKSRSSNIVLKDQIVNTLTVNILSFNPSAAYKNTGLFAVFQLVPYEEPTGERGGNAPIDVSSSS